MSIFALSQASNKINGVVLSVDGSALPGANVSILGTNIGTASDEGGSYTIMLPSDIQEGDALVLTASYIGYKPSEKSISISPEGNSVNFSLDADVLGVEEVVVTALGISKARKHLDIVSKM